MKARDRYRVRRDRKIAVDWIGREFELELWDELHGIEQLKVRIDAYNPDNHTVTMRPMWATVGAPFVWSTDEFWSMLKTGRLVIT